MQKDKRYNILKSLIEVQKLTRFEDIFDVIPKSVIAGDLNIHYYGLVNRITNPPDFSIQEIIDLSRLIEVDPLTLLHLILKTTPQKSRKKTI